MQRTKGVEKNWMIGSKVRLCVPPVALAFPEFIDGAMIKTPGSITEFKVSIEKPAVEHCIRLNRVQKWVQTTTKEGPARILKRQRVKALIGSVT